MAVTTLGQLKINDALPPEMRGQLPVFDKKAQVDFFTRMSKTVEPEVYKETLYKLQQLGNAIASTYGGVTSVGLDDLTIPPALKQLREQIQKEINAIVQNPAYTSQQRKKLVTDTVMKYTPIIDKKVIEETSKAGNGLALQVSTGMRGKPFQLRQMLFGDLLSMDSNNKIIPVPTLRSYAEGITPTQYWIASHGGRKGYRDLQFATADSGYFSKMVRQTVHRQQVTSEDCGNPRPFIVNANDEDSIGSLLYADVKGKSGKVYKKDTPITEDILDDLSNNETLKIRSAAACGNAEGVCSKCAGIRETGKLPEIGDRIGLNGVNSFLEPLGQSALDSKHGGGEASSSQRKLKGLKAVYQFINTPETFVGGAIAAPADGVVGELRPAPQGGNFVRIGAQDVYIPPGHTLNKKQGESVEEGDILTDGMVDMKEIVRTKGIGEARKVFIDELSKLLNESNAGTMRKNVESFANGYINKVEITDPEGVAGWIMGDIADYNKLAANYTPRDGYEDKDPESAKGMYLEAPALHYTIGTRITPSVAKTLKKYGVQHVVAHAKEPSFAPVLIPARTFSTEDEDWLTSLSGENLMRTIGERATRGSDSFKQSTSYYPELALMNSDNSAKFEL